MALHRLPRLQCVASATLRCSSCAVRWAVGSTRHCTQHTERSPHLQLQHAHPVSQINVAGAPPLSRPHPQHRRRRLPRAASSSTVAADAANGSGEHSGRFVVTTPLYYVNAGQSELVASHAARVALLGITYTIHRHRAVHSGPDCNSSSAPPGRCLLHDGCGCHSTLPGECQHKVSSMSDWYTDMA
jgi:hypothetical protein